MNGILIIDDEVKLRSLIARIIRLEGDGNFLVAEADNGKAALKKIAQENFDVIICDVKLPDINGVELIKEIKARQPLTEIILLTAYGNIPDGVQAIKNGAFDYITKGDDNNKILPLLYKAIEKVSLARRVEQLEKQLEKRYSFDNIIGKSRVIKGTVSEAKKVAETEATVLLTAETGSGKEVFAQAIHNASKRNKGNFVAVNCAAFSKELLENELFGHKEGAFTGATKETKGLFEEANHGTVFLDEIGEMTLDLQSKLLRVLETSEFLKVGDSKPTKVDVRVIAATNRNLLKEVELGNFREDLYYRIAVFQIVIPPLRDRLMDIDEFALRFVQQFAIKTNKKILSISGPYLEALKLHAWKGNIRELKNVIERSVILTEGDALMIESLPVELKERISSHNKSKILSDLALASAEKAHIQKVLHYTNGNKTEAARLLNIALTTLYRKLDEYQIK